MKRMTEIVAEARKSRVICDCPRCRLNGAFFDVLDAGLELEHALRADDELVGAPGEVRECAAEAIHVARKKHEAALDAALALLEAQP